VGRFPQEWVRPQTEGLRIVLKRIAVSELQVGMYIDELCGSWMEHPFWRTRFALKDKADVSRIVESGIRQVWIDTEKGIDADWPGPYAPTRSEADAEVERRLLQSAETGSAQAADRVSFTEELERARVLYARTRPAVLSMFGEARMGRAVSPDMASELVDEVFQSVQRNSTALISLSRLKRADDYTYMHSVAVCGLMIALAKQLGMSEAQTREAGLGGLMHDIGKSRLPDRILRKPDKLSDDEWAKMRTHPEIGHAILSNGPYGPIPMEVVLHHHEKVDGSGYPHRLTGDSISVFAKMAGVCDVYDAITSNRPYKTGWLPAEAIRKMAEWAPGHFDDRVFHAFVKTVGIYPVGTLVRLGGGRLGVVVEHNERALLKPTVKAFFSISSQSRIAPEVIDLARARTSTRIVGREDPAAWGLTRIDELWNGQPIHL
jgi:HD-GYP domain-containing protein (c-di-GMP phosphodiesterase class II)